MRSGEYAAAELGVVGRRQIAEAAVRPDGVVVELPGVQRGASMGERAKQSLIQQLVPKAAVEAFYEGVLLWLAGGDVVPFDTRVLAPAQQRHAGQLGEDIKRRNLQQPVTLLMPKGGDEPVLLDGRNRLAAMEAVGMTVIGAGGKLAARHETRLRRLMGSTQSPSSPRPTSTADT